MHSDNGSSFVRLAKLTESERRDLPARELLAKVDWEEVQRRTEKVGVRKWDFSPPYYPQQNGTAEVMVKLAKAEIMHQVRDRVVPLDELRDLVKRAQISINERPIAYEEVDGVPTVITPNTLMFGRAGAVAISEDPQAPVASLKQFREVQRLHEQFVQGWKAKVLQNMHSREKWKKMKKNLEPGQLVVVAMPDDKRWTWPLGRVTNIVKNREGVVHEAFVNVVVKNKLVEWRKTVRHLVPLDLFTSA